MVIGRAMLTAAIRPALMIGAGALVAFAIPKALDWNDKRQARLRSSQITAAAAHEANADLNRDSSAALVAEAPAIRQPYDVLVASPEVRSSPIARRVAAGAAPVIRNLEGQVRTKAKEASELRKEVDVLKETPPPPEPRLVPYAAAGLATTSGRLPADPWEKPRLHLTAGVDYRVWKLKANLEGTYQPPPKPPPGIVTENPRWLVIARVRVDFR